MSAAPPARQPSPFSQPPTSERAPTSARLPPLGTNGTSASVQRAKRRNQAAPPALVVNVAKALKRDYYENADPSTKPFIRAFLMGYAFSVGPALIKAVFALALPRNKELVASQRVIRFIKAALKSIARGIDPRGLAFVFGISFGGAKWLEKHIKPLVESTYYAVHGGQRRKLNGRTGTEPLPSPGLKLALSELDSGDPASSSTPAAAVAMMRDEENMGLLTTLTASVLSSAFALTLLQSSPSYSANPRATLMPLPVHDGDEQALSESTLAATARKLPRRESPTLDLTLFMLVRGVDTLVRGIYVAHPRWHRIFGGMAAQADTIVFWLSCWRIMFCWFYLPHRLPPSYVRWITNLSRMDVRLLRLLRDCRNGDWQYGKVPKTEALRATGPKIAIAMGFPPEAAMPDLIPTLPCTLVHGKVGNTESCEVNAIKRWGVGWLQCMGIYLPVHALPRLLFGKRAFAANPVRTLLQVFLAAGQSSAFLATFIASVYAFVCLGRTRLLPKLFPSVSQNFWDGGFAPALGCFMCGFSVLIENKRRRGEMALYVAPRAVYAVMDEVLPEWLFSGKTGQLVSKYSERSIFALSTGVVTAAAVHRPALLRGLMRGVLRYLVGDWDGDARQAPETPRRADGKRIERADLALRLQDAKHLQS
ncbi:uncharacterized protein L969DRAFT_20467 [Mixia osmundae IAM 14324]|uniref:Transmembrane protein 135 N-terminal domain-containing protein n=1 Tax=Mixia osmundae (strain CBS 9802 / IAM 14324 / JCM 22182 / KY 12970) TaxID=764103 RepID=G7E4G6_MIXOS|nr:uncharacterized protein L969DRAFT_20467 [Mixia osmundae IAM 14324]KEI36257.1 hypothetical protein L969DRAFT_20467 [Mixia osmundae IAM 14324]GAA97726.1 hypothetical protein E5Q_04405 [Mixia osmundae IAM 14324]